MTDREREKRNQEIAERVISPPCETDEDVKARIDALRGSFDDCERREKPEFLSFEYNLEKLEEWRDDLLADPDCLGGDQLAWACAVIQESASLRRQLSAAREALAEIGAIAAGTQPGHWCDVRGKIRRIAEIAKGGRGG